MRTLLHGLLLGTAFGRDYPNLKGRANAVVRHLETLDPENCVSEQPGSLPDAFKKAEGLINNDDTCKGGNHIRPFFDGKAGRPDLFMHRILDCLGYIGNKECDDPLLNKSANELTVIVETSPAFRYGYVYPRYCHHDDNIRKWWGDYAGILDILNRCNETRTSLEALEDEVSKVGLQVENNTGSLEALDDKVSEAGLQVEDNTGLIQDNKNAIDINKNSSLKNQGLITQLIKGHVQMQQNIESKASKKELEQTKQEMEKKFKAMEKKIIENVTASTVASGSQVDHTSGTDVITGFGLGIGLGIGFHIGRRLTRGEEGEKPQLTTNEAQTIDDDNLSQASTTLPYDSGLPHASTVGAYSSDVP